MILAPIDSRQFAPAPSSRRANPASCRLPQLLRLTLLAALGGSLVFVALGARGAHNEPTQIAIKG